MDALVPALVALGRSLDGEVLLPGTEEFLAHPPVRAANFDAATPRAIVVPRSEHDIRSVVAFARRLDLQVAARSSGHSAGGLSTGVGLVIDMSRFDAISLEGNRVTVGGGCRTGAVASYLAARGRALPMGTCPSVGIAGLTLGGGFGHLGRRYGLTLDRLVEARLVTAAGELAMPSEKSHPDLFWALRGAGSVGLGVITAMTFETVPLEPQTLFVLTWPAEAVAVAMAKWMEYADGGSRDVMMELVLDAPSDPAEAPYVMIVGSLIGNVLDVDGTCRDLTDAIGPPATSQVWRHLLGDRLVARLDALMDPAAPATPARQYRAMRSGVLRQPLDGAAIEKMAAKWLAPRPAGQQRTIEFAPWAGAYNDIGPEATAFPHRDALFVAQCAAMISPASGYDKRVMAEDWTRECASIVSVHSLGVYANFPEPEHPAIAEACFRGNAQRVLSIKAALIQEIPSGGYWTSTEPLIEV